MAWLSVQIVVEILLAAALGAVVGWFLHTLYGKQQAARPAKAEAKSANEADLKLRLSELEAELGRTIAEADDLRRKSGIARPGERSEGAPEGSLTWRNRHLESRVRFLEGRLADFESEGGALPPREDQNDEATRLRWRNRYLDGRVKYLEEELLRTGGLHAPTASAPPAAAAKPPETEKPELFEQPREGRSDDLKLISGIGPKVEQKLNSLGVWHYAQISSWSQKEINWVNHAISFAGRIERENWVTQAAQLLERQSQGDLEEETNA